MTKKYYLATLAVAMALAGTAATTQAQVAGSTTLGVTVTDIQQIATGWSVKKSILGKNVYNDADKKIGKVEDLIVDRASNVSYVIVGVGGFIGLGKHDVAIPTSQIHEKAGKIVLAGATKESLKALAPFEYAPQPTRHDQVVADAEQHIDQAKQKIAELQKRSEAGAADVKAELDKQVAALKQDQKSVEDKLTALKAAGAKDWKKLEAEVANATAKLRKSLKRTAV